MEAGHAASFQIFLHTNPAAHDWAADILLVGAIRRGFENPTALAFAERFAFHIIPLAVGLRPVR